MKALKALKTLKKYYKEDKKPIILLGFLIVFSNFEVLFFAAIWGYVLEFIMAKKFLEAVLFLLLQLGLFFLDVAIDSLINWLQSRLEKSMLSKLQSDLFSKVIDFPAVSFEEHSVGEFNNRILGDATGEMGPFVSEKDPDGGTRKKSSWYGDFAHFVYSYGHWFIRGGYWGDGSGSGAFAFGDNSGGTGTCNSFRMVLSPAP